MDCNVLSQRVRRLALVGGVALLVAGGALPAEATPPFPARLRVELGSSAGLAPDGQSVGIGILASCPERWTVLQATVTLLQSQASEKRPSA